MKVLYIGGTGEISLECVKASAAAGDDVTVLNRGQSDEPLPQSVRRVAGDLKQPGAYDALAGQSFDAICQFKAYDLAQLDKDLAAFANRCGQYIFISSASAYQKPPLTHLITESIPLSNPFWPYSQSKADMEARLMEWHRAKKLPVTVVRPSHTYRTHVPGTCVSGDAQAHRLLQGKPIVIHGDGTALWTLTHSSDFAVPFVKLLGNPRALGEAFHITSDVQHTWDQIHHALAAALGVKADLVHVPTDTLVRYNRDWAGPLLGDKTWPVVFDNSKVKSVAGAFQCKISLEEGMKGVARAFRERAANAPPDPATQALLDRIIADQQKLGSPQ